MKNKHYERLISILSTLEEHRISNVEKLMLPEHTSKRHELIIALQNYVDYYALASKTSKNKKGEFLAGNEERVKCLIEKGGWELYDIQADILNHVLNKLDIILLQAPVAKQTFYIYRIVNNKVIDMLRNMKKIESIPWDAPIASDKCEDGFCISEVFSDQSYDPEYVFYEKERIKELKQIIKEKKAAEKAEKRIVILNEVLQLSKHPAEIMIRLGCRYLGLKPRKLAGVIIEKGTEQAYAEILYKIAKAYDIRLADIRSMISDNIPTSKNLKAEDNNPKTISSEISRINYRACKHLSKDSNEKKTSKSIEEKI